MMSTLTFAVMTLTVRPNIIVILADDHARSATSCYGSNLIQTPGIDRIARQGVRFDRHYTSNPICGPSRASLLTGKYSHKNGFKDNDSKFDGSQVTFPKLLQSKGYETSVIGKWHLVSEPTGFDHWEILPGQGAYYNPEFITPQGRQKNEGYVSEITTTKAVSWLQRKHSKPYFLLIGHKAPHRSWIPSVDRIPLFENRIFPEPVTLRTDHATLTSGAKTVGMRVDADMRPAEDLMVGFVPSALTQTQRGAWQTGFSGQDEAYRSKLEKTGDLLGTNYQRYLQNYLRCVDSVDDGVVEVLDFLDNSGQSQNTIVIYASDQGFFLGENGWYDKRWFYEPSAGTPLVMCGPSIGRGKKVSTLTSNVDLAPTILELAGLRGPAEMQGSSLLPQLKGKKTNSIPAYGHFYESNDGEHKVPKYISLCTDRYKLIRYYELAEWELFDLERDPNERENRWFDPELSGTIRTEMVRKLLERARQVGEVPEILDLFKLRKP